MSGERGRYQSATDPRGRQEQARRERQMRDRAVQLRADESRYGGHAFLTHVDVGPAQTARRALERYQNPKNRQSYGDATRWTADRALARAVMAVERTKEYRDRTAAAQAALDRGQPASLTRPVVRVAARDALGPDWRQHVAGHRADANGTRPMRFEDDAMVIAVYQPRPGGGWVLHTCYPVPNRRGRGSVT
jgi:hypothetical protein